ncbi:hypothetical protein, partial [Marinobacter mangrovi]|uniref:hypothetical protein n=1 Tax=Marinobacter mangrovi TaxID=2803918 RepID=UPI001F47A5E9
STSKSFFLITGSDMLFNNADKIAKRMIRFFISETKNPNDSDFKRYPVLIVGLLNLGSSVGRTKGC